VADIFQEVDEEVRRERLKKLWDKYSIVIIALAILVVAVAIPWLFIGLTVKALLSAF